MLKRRSEDGNGNLMPTPHGRSLRSDEGPYIPGSDPEAVLAARSELERNPGARLGPPNVTPPCLAGQGRRKPPVHVEGERSRAS
ncbi:hypothetical protein K8R03_02495 [Candidatus Kaiserbacteria bacterium]|nr:hypothetical protein [Candidatus Kaiserbacteria bacterium]